MMLTNSPGLASMVIGPSAWWSPSRDENVRVTPRSAMALPRDAERSAEGSVRSNIPSLAYLSVPRRVHGISTNSSEPSMRLKARPSNAVAKIAANINGMSNRLDAHSVR